MRTIGDWLDEYAQGHVDPLNQKFHFACIPLIVFSVWGMLRAVPVGTDLVNLATVSGVLAIVYYIRLSAPLALGAALAFVVMYAGVLALKAAVGSYLLAASVAIFVVSWVGQFVGHKSEGKKPSFFKDLQFLLIGPLWELAHLYRALGLPVSSSHETV